MCDACAVPHLDPCTHLHQWSRGGRRRASASRRAHLTGWHAPWHPCRATTGGACDSALPGPPPCLLFLQAKLGLLGWQPWDQVHPQALPVLPLLALHAGCAARPCEVMVAMHHECNKLQHCTSIARVIAPHHPANSHPGLPARCLPTPHTHRMVLQAC